ncbi:MAG: AMIN domain-containing protein [bacterium]|nr:AMIN domain-containing protein [bacterium]
MKRFAVIFIIGLLLSGAQIMAAEVTNVELSYQEGAVVARIDVEGQIRFTHETEVPKNGRPDRVIVDVLSATHELGGKEYLELPDCVIQSIRSSQFAVTPEKIVRVVFDLGKSPIYKVDIRDNSIFLQFTDAKARSFATWSTSGVKPAEKKQKAPAVASAPKVSRPVVKAESATATAARKNKAIESDRMASLESEKKKVVKAAPASKPAPSSKAVPKKVEKKTAPAGFNQLLAQATPAPVAEKAKPAEVKATPKAPKAKPVQKAPAKKSADSKVKASTKTEPVPAAKPAASPAKAAPKKVKKEKAPSPLPKSAPAKKLVSTPASAPKVTVATKTAQPQMKAEQPRKKAPAPKKKAKSAGVGQKALAQKAAADKSAKSVKPASKPAAKPGPKVAQKQEVPAKKKTATSRFRRSAASNKIKGTLVAEFPKRLVVKYKSSHYRDPFKTLIDAARTQNVPVEQRIANVEGLKLVGIIESDGGSNRALFEDQEGYGYMLESGDKVRNGYVLRVETDRVYFQIFEYGWSRTVALKMD